MMQSLLLIVITALVTWLATRWIRSQAPAAKALTGEEREIGRAKKIGTQLDGARDRATLAEVERNKVALAKAVKAALWVTEARLNVAVPELLRIAQLWAGQSKAGGAKSTAPAGVTEIEGRDDRVAPWASWVSDGHHWRLEADLGPSILAEEMEGDIGTCRVFVDHELMLDMTINRTDSMVLWIDALTVGPWVSDILNFAGVQSSSAQSRSSAQSARENQDRADNIHWS